MALHLTVAKTKTKTKTITKTKTKLLKDPTCAIFLASPDALEVIVVTPSALALT